MTVSAVATETVYTLEGAALGPFSTVWPYEIPSNVAVYLDTGTGPTLLTTVTEYTLVSAGAGSLTNGGDVTLLESLLPESGDWAAGTILTLQRITSDDQPSAFGEMAGFSPSANESAIDHVERQVQELATKVARALLFAFGEAGFQLPEPAQRTGGLVLGFDPVTGAPKLVAMPDVLFPAFPPLAGPPPDPATYQTYFDTTLGYPRIYLTDGQWHGFLLS